MDTDNSVLMARGKGDGGKRGRNGDICNSVNNKNKEKEDKKNTNMHIYAYIHTKKFYFRVNKTKNIQ